MLPLQSTEQSTAGEAQATTSSQDAASRRYGLLVAHAAVFAEVAVRNIRTKFPHPPRYRPIDHLWFAEAGANGAFPLDDRSAVEIINTPGRSWPARATGTSTTPTSPTSPSTRR